MLSWRRNFNFTSKSIINFQYLRKKSLLKRGFSSKEIQKWECNRFLPQYHKITQKERDEKDEAVILVNTILPLHFQKFWKGAKLKICADGGANRLFDFFENHTSERTSYIPNIIKGDLDSMRKPVREFYTKHGSKIIEEKDQNSTDLEKCLNEVSEKWRVIVLGGLEGNFTQSLANLNTLYSFKHEISVLGQENVIFFLRPGKHLVHCKKLTKVGLIPLGLPCNSITTKGLKWNLNKSKLAFGGLISTSNKMEEDYAEIEISDPILWICDFRK